MQGSIDPNGAPHSQIVEGGCYHGSPAPGFKSRWIAKSRWIPVGIIVLLAIAFILLWK
jgi:hypothetical protein